MSLLPSAPNRWTFRYTNQSGPSLTPGTSVVPGASNAEGSATAVATGANLSEDTYGILLWVTGGNTTATSKLHLLDIGADPAGGTAYQWLVENLEVGNSGTAIAGGIFLFVPLFVKAGSQVAVRIQGNQATAGTVRVGATFFGRPTRPELVQKLTRSETLGTIATSSGPAVTPGESAAEGAWTSIGTTTFPWRYIIPTLQIDDGTTNSQVIHMDVAYGDASNKIILRENIPYVYPGSAEVSVGFEGVSGAIEGWCDVPSGTTIYARLSTNLATADASYDVLVTGLG